MISIRYYKGNLLRPQIINKIIFKLYIHVHIYIIIVIWVLVWRNLKLCNMYPLNTSTFLCKALWQEKIWQTLTVVAILCNLELWATSSFTSVLVMNMTFFQFTIWPEKKKIHLNLHLYVQINFAIRILICIQKLLVHWLP